MTQYVTREGIQAGTANILKAGWPPGDGKPSAQTVPVLGAWEAHRDAQVSVLEAEKQGYKNIKC